MNRYNKRLQSGLCPQCGGKRDTAFISCSKCNNYFKEYKRNHYDSTKNTKRVKKYRNDNRMNGVCPICGSRIDDSKYKLCSKCRARSLISYHRDPLAVKLRHIEKLNRGSTTENALPFI